MGKGGIASAKIVERNAHTHVVHPAQIANGIILVRQKRGLRHLDLQPVGCQAGVDQGAEHHGRQGSSSKLVGRDVDGHARSVLPAGCIPAGFVEHEFPQPVDEAALLRHRDEHRR